MLTENILKNFYEKLLGTSPDFSDWNIKYENKEVLVKGKVIANLFKNVYLKKVGDVEYSVAKYIFYNKPKVVAFGPVGSCAGHVFVNEEGKYELLQEGCIDFSILTLEKENYFSKTYYPIYFFLTFTFALSLIVTLFFGDQSMFWMEFMRYYMAFFFIVFASLKLMNISGFAKSFIKYDPLAKFFPFYGFVYPFLEILLGYLFLMNLYLLFANILTVLILSITSVGILNTIKKGDKLNCACLGGFFNIPIGPITVFENLVMIIMALYMLYM